MCTLFVYIMWSHSESHAFMLPCIVTDFFFNNQPDALIIEMYSDIKLCMFREQKMPETRRVL
jgi:hypothetical protein